MKLPAVQKQFDGAKIGQVLKVKLQKQLLPGRRSASLLALLVKRGELLCDDAATLALSIGFWG